MDSLDAERLDPEILQSYYAAVDEQHDDTSCPINKDDLKISKGIEVGHIFYFGTKYSEKLNALFRIKMEKEFQFTWALMVLEFQD